MQTIQYLDDFQNLKDLLYISSFAETTNILALKLFNIMEKKSILSPTSISYLVSLFHILSDGIVHTQISDVIGEENSIKNLTEIYNNCNNNKYINDSSIIKIINCIIINNKIKLNDQFLFQFDKIVTIMSKNFSNPIFTADECNYFINQQTNYLIQNMVKPELITADASLILINVLYFKTIWRTSFNKELTKYKLFNMTQSIPIMKQQALVNYYENSNVQIIDLPFVYGKFSMKFVLPKYYIGLIECGRYLFKDISKQQQYVDYEIPKFTQRSKIDLVPLLKKIGITNLFNERNGNLSKISHQPIFVSKAIHEAVVIVDEEGTPAFSTTETRSGCESCINTLVLSSESESKYIKCYFNRSFVYSIFDTTNNNILYIGTFEG